MYRSLAFQGLFSSINTPNYDFPSAATTTCSTMPLFTTSMFSGPEVHTNPDDPPMLLEVFQHNPKFIPGDYKDIKHQGAFPFDLYDRHTSPELALRRVVLQPALPVSLAKNVDSTIEEAESRGMERLPYLLDAGDYVSPNFAKQVRQKSFGDRLVWRYGFSVGRFTPPFISRWVLHPTASNYYSALQFSECDDSLPSYWESVASSTSLRFRPFRKQRPEILSLISEQQKDALRSLEEKDLIIYQFYHMTAAMEQVFRDMDTLPANLPTAAHTTGGLEEVKLDPERHPPCDAENVPWEIPGCSSPNTSSHSIFLPGRTKIVPRPDLGPDSNLTDTEKPTAAGLCYHAWNKAVMKDATVIVLHCGNYERIGIRHRATQTLILSDLIEVSKCQDPAYGKIHVGLMLAAVQDALDRHGQSYAPQTSPIPIVKRKHSIETTELRRSKRQKVKSQMASLAPAYTPPALDSEKLFWKSFVKCSIALVRLDFNTFCSPIPAVCLRRGGLLSPYGIGDSTSEWKKSYHISSCCTLTIDSDLSSGGTGRVHTARLEVRMADGSTHSRNVVVKSAVDDHLRKRLRREYDVYRHAWKQKVDRIPMVYGLFEDVDDTVTLLVIERFKMSFRQREPRDFGNRGMLLNVSKVERSICLTTIRALHKAGVAHMDLRAENIMVGYDGLPVIIDFDRGWVGAPKGLMDKEVEYLQQVLDGKTQDQFPFEQDSDEV